MTFFIEKFMKQQTNKNKSVKFQNSVLVWDFTICLRQHRIKHN